MTLNLKKSILIHLSIVSSYLCNQIIQAIFVAEENTEVSKNLTNDQFLGLPLSHNNHGCDNMDVITWMR